MTERTKTAPQKRYTPPPVTAERLRFLALRYVARYASSVGMLEKTLRRHIQKSRFLHPQHDHAPLENTITALLEEFGKKGFVNDAGLADSLIRNARSAGLSRQKIAQKLQVKGISRAMIKEKLGGEEADEWRAALTFIKRKKMGAHRAKDIDQKKEMARMCRAGFSIDIARRALNYTGDEE